MWFAKIDGIAVPQMTENDLLKGRWTKQSLYRSGDDAFAGALQVLAEVGGRPMVADDLGWAGAKEIGGRCGVVEVEDIGELCFGGALGEGCAVGEVGSGGGFAGFGFAGHTNETTN